MRRVVPALPALVLLFASACGTTTIPSTGVKTCRATPECGAGYSCLFSVYQSCGNPGVCIANVDGSACVRQTACGCDGATTTVCLVNGTSPAPVESLGSCDGATQEGYDASVPPAPDSSVTPADAADAFVPPVVDAGPTVDSAPGVDAADATMAPTLGSPCTANAQCTDPVYNLCRDPGTGTKICTAFCLAPSQCQPPPNGTCNPGGYCVLQ